MEQVERINPMRWTDTDGVKYTFDFDKKSVLFAEQRGFKVEDFFDYLKSKAPEFFFYACRMHHGSLSRTQTDALLEKMGGLTMTEWSRLVDLFRQAQYSHVVISDEDVAKNRVGTVELD